MADCNLKDFPEHTLQLNHLKMLVLDNNPKGSTNEAKLRLDNIQHLSLKSCLLSDICGWKLHNVKHLDASCNAIQYFPSDLGEHIAVLKLSNNQLDTIPDEISCLQNLTELDVSECGLKEFPNSVLKLQKLIHLNISDNFIHVIPGDLLKMDLTKLFIGRNPLDEFPQFLDHLLHLEVIDLSSCFLETFPLMTPTLREIVLNGNCIPEITEDICQLKLTKIFMKENSLNELPHSFQNMTELQSIDFSSTNLNAVPWQILKLDNLRKLRMRNNAIEQLPDEWNQCVNLTLLDLSENPFYTLETLKLESCCFSEFPEVLLQLQALKDLDLGQNLIPSLPNNFDRLHLKRLNVQDNLLHNLPDTHLLLIATFSI